VFCAFGCLVSDLVHDAVRNTHGVSFIGEPLTSAFAEIEAQGNAWLDRQTQPGQILGRDSLRFGEMRYAAQSFTIPVDLAAASHGDGGMAAAEAAFHDEHQRLFGHANRKAPVAIDALRVRTIGRQPKPEARPMPRQAVARIEPIERRPIHLGGRWLPDTPVYAWGDLPFGSSIAGPAIVQQDLATILVPDGFGASVGALGDLDIRKA
jgi:N-methylhydantoinase A